ncbi:hypothetical protein H5410_001611 [Solanum commersonii]|uniref:Leucine-rich repeat-containing N-terminal plant-type domain-containing protein n=1 Tax=Solanum commersonii TaxID=4109 RepID=A0A9J6AZH1_SOLCO|nr:hypothetical protein H5410_001611 [Solanum commersonii]
MAYLIISTLATHSSLAVTSMAFSPSSSSLASVVKGAKMGIGKLALFLLYTFLCQLIFSSSYPHLCPNDQALALLQFNHMLTINLDASSSDYYPKTVKWSRSIDCCSWYGVNHLRGEFHSNSSLFKLSNLKMLDFLTHLDLSYSSFTGIIPAKISHLSKLHVLSIESDQYELRFEPYNFELFLKNLTQLRELHLSSDFQTCRYAGYCPKEFSTFLTWNLLIYQTIPSSVLVISQSFGHLTSLRRLRIASCSISGFIPNPLWNLTNIEVLDLGYNHFEGPISNFFRFGKIKSLSLRNNNFNGNLSSYPVIDGRNLHY